MKLQSTKSPAIATRIPILYVILGVLIAVSVVPMYFYSQKVMDINRGQLKTNERLLQSTTTRSLSEDISQRQISVRAMLGNLVTAVQVVSGGNLGHDQISSPELRALLEQFVSSSDYMAYATLLNSDAKGISTGRVPADDFVQRELERAFAAARDGRMYTGQAIAVGTTKNHHVLMLVSTPLTAGGRFLGMIATAVDLSYLERRLQEMSKGGMLAYVVDREGRIVAAADPHYPTGQDMTKMDIVRNFVDASGRILAATTEFRTPDGTDMLGTYSPVPSLEWAVIAQKPQREAYAAVYEVQSAARWLAFGMAVVSVFIGVFAASRITGPLRVLTEHSRALARGDFSQRVQLTSRTEIGELAQTFNHMSDDLERFVFDLKRAAEENRALFLGSIQMLAGAVDEKDPYTRGHSERVTRYSVILATELGLPQEEIEKIRIAALLHDVGKIGIEDSILKKPGALTPEEFEVMKTHTTRGAAILRPVAQLKDMIPGIELHHESMDGRGYPHGLKADQIPLAPRIIMVADTFDAMTTNRPYQQPYEPEFAIEKIKSMVGRKFDPKVVNALAAVFGRGDLRLRRASKFVAEQAMAVAAIPMPDLDGVDAPPLVL